MEKIDPKVFFSNERTYLKWLHTSVTIGSIASGLLGFSGLANKNSYDTTDVDGAGPGSATNVTFRYNAVRLIALALLLVSILFCGYAILSFQKRNRLLATKAGSGYDNFQPPLMLGIFMVITLATIYGVYLTQYDVPM